MLASLFNDLRVAPTRPPHGPRRACARARAHTHTRARVRARAAIRALYQNGHARGAARATWSVHHVKDAETSAKKGPPRRAAEGTERKVTYDPGADSEGDRATLSEEEAFEDVHPYATAETYEAAARRDPAAFPGSALRETAPGDEPVEGSGEAPRDATPMGPRRKE